MIEIETKVFNIDKNKIIEKIKSVGGEFIGETDIVGTYFKKGSQKIRIRKLNGSFFACMKIKNEEYSEGIRTRKEYEFEVSDDEAFIGMIENLGFSFHKDINKFRTSYKKGDIMYDIDEYKDGLTVLEIEGDSIEKIKEAALELGLKLSDLSSESVTDFLKKRNGILFLDIDGVLVKLPNKENVKETKEIYGSLGDGNINLISKESIDLLKELVEETGVSIVLSSSWRFYEGLLDTLYRKSEELGFNLKEKVISRTLFLDGGRGEEIEEYIRENKIDRFVILDDCDYRISDNEFIKDHLILTNGYEGFTRKDKEKSIEALEIKKELN